MAGLRPRETLRGAVRWGRPGRRGTGRASESTASLESTRESCQVIPEITARTSGGEGGGGGWEDACPSGLETQQLTKNSPGGALRGRLTRRQQRSGSPLWSVASPGGGRARQPTAGPQGAARGVSRTVSQSGTPKGRGDEGRSLGHSRRGSRTNKGQDAEHEQQGKASCASKKFTVMKPCLTTALATEGLTCFVICTGRLLEAARRHKRDLDGVSCRRLCPEQQLIRSTPHPGLSGGEFVWRRQLYKESHPRTIVPKACEGHDVSPRDSTALQSL